MSNPCYTSCPDISADDPWMMVQCGKVCYQVELMWPPIPNHPNQGVQEKVYLVSECLPVPSLYRWEHQEPMLRRPTAVQALVDQQVSPRMGGMCWTGL